jgi:hypothetical protein
MSETTEATEATIDWWAKYQKDQEVRRTANKEEKLPLLAKLKDAGIHKLVISYEGSGDSGEIHNHVVYGKDGEEAPILLDGLEEEVDEFCYQLLQDNYGGWEINEGSFGEIVMMPTPRRITYTHNQRIEEVETTTGKY